MLTALIGVFPCNIQLPIIPTLLDAGWQEQILIRLDEIVGLLNSINCRLACWEKGNAGAEGQSGGRECVGCKGVGCHCTQETGHLTPTLGEEQSQ